MGMKPLFQVLARTFDAWNACKKTGNAEWESHLPMEDRIEELVKEHMPYGSGFDSGTDFDFDASKPEKLVFHTAFHHMNEGGYYDGWTEHTVTIIPSFSYSSGFDMRISGRNRNDIKDMIGEAFRDALDTLVDDGLVNTFSFPVPGSGQFAFVREEVQP